MGGQRAPEVKSCDHRKNRYGPLNIEATTNFWKTFLQLLSILCRFQKKKFENIKRKIMDALCLEGDNRKINFRRKRVGALSWFLPKKVERATHVCFQRKLPMIPFSPRAALSPGEGSLEAGRFQEAGMRQDPRREGAGSNDEKRKFVGAGQGHKKTAEPTRD